MCKISCGDCDSSYIGQTNKRIQNTGHRIDFENTNNLASIKHKNEGSIKGTIEIEQTPDNSDVRDDTQSLPTVLKLALNRLVQMKQLNGCDENNKNERTGTTATPTPQLGTQIKKSVLTSNWRHFV